MTEYTQCTISILDQTTNVGVSEISDTLSRAPFDESFRDQATLTAAQSVN